MSWAPYSGASNKELRKASRNHKQHSQGFWSKAVGFAKRYGPTALAAGRAIAKIAGYGDYNFTEQASYPVKQNVLYNLSQQVPQFQGDRTHVEICHREYIGDITSSATPGAFKIQNFNLNVGDQTTFPWLSEVCKSTFQQYRMMGCVFEFRTMSADALNSTNTALGSVMMGTNYDVMDHPWSSKQQMANSEFSMTCKPSESMTHPIECAPQQTSIQTMYIRNGGENDVDDDPRFYDLGRFSIATVGMQAASVNVGELWVTYRVRLYKAVQLVPFATIPISAGRFTAFRELILCRALVGLGIISISRQMG